MVDDQNVIRRIGIQQSPRPHLALLNEGKLDSRVAPRLGFSGDLVLAVTRGKSTDTVQSLSKDELKAGEKVELKGRVVWGPETVGPLVFVATFDELHCFEGIKKRWTTPLPYGALTGVPLVDGEDFILSSSSGTVWRIAGSEGKEVNKVDLGQPIVGQGLSHDGRIWMPGYDGSILVVPMINPS